jgi:DNA polymerase V
MENDDQYQGKAWQLKGIRYIQVPQKAESTLINVTSTIGVWNKAQTQEQSFVLEESVGNVYLPDVNTKLELPLQTCAVPAGFPSPAEDYIEQKLDLNSYLVTHPAATFFVRASGDSMLGASIQDGDLLIVDRAIEASHNDIVIAVVQGEITVKRLHYLRGKISLVPENDSYKTITINEHSELHIWGVVTNVIHCVKPKSHKKICSGRLQ